MELEELTAYARETYHLREDRRWPDLPGFSVLAHPETGQWVALLMRQWVSDLGREVQRCDIRCPRRDLPPGPFLTAPFRMKGPNWVGVIPEECREPEAVFRLLDRAMREASGPGARIVLEDPAPGAEGRYQDTRIPASGTAGRYQDTRIPASGARPLRQTGQRPPAGGRRTGRWTLSPEPAPRAVPDPAEDPALPAPIRDLLRMDVPPDGSFAAKCENFCRQGKRMEDYEDTVPWTGTWKHYFPTYHDLTIPQLRGYFTWRAGVRRGSCGPIAPSLACLYVYELLNGIGAASPGEAFAKLGDFSRHFLDRGLGDLALEGNVRRWMLEFAVVHALPPQDALAWADPALRDWDEALAVLREPEKGEDGAVFAALCRLGPGKLPNSPAVTKGGEDGVRLFAAVWRQAGDLFEDLFGLPQTLPWHPLGSAVFWRKDPWPDADYTLDSCRRYTCRDGVWQETRYDVLRFRREKLHGLLREADRQLRRYLKTGHYLRERPGDAWAAPIVQRALASEEARRREAARPVVTFDLSGLERIRREALETRDSLLTDDELAELALLEAEPAEPAEAPSSAAPLPEGAAGPLDPVQTMIVAALLRGEGVQALLEAEGIMPTLAADAVNEALFDLVGDAVLDCDGSALAVVEDYREELEAILGGG